MNISNLDCWLNIDKPIGYSSAKIVSIVKKITGAKKVGHGGTLDPFACGVLPLALNKATKTSEKLLSAKKKYCFTIKFGEFRDTDDIEGNVEQISNKIIDAQELSQVLVRFIGKISQTPSKFSAIKIDGKRAYDLARQGIQFEMKNREVEIFSISLLNCSPLFAQLVVECSKGTYIRSLARAICVELEVCGYVYRLQRIKVGNFLQSKTISLDELKAKVNNDCIFLDGSLLLLHDVFNVEKP